MTSTEDAAVEKLNQATSELAQVEGLIAAGALRLTRVRPALHAENRRASLSALGLSPDLRVFTDMLEAVGSVPDFPGSLSRTLAPQAQDLYRRFGILIPQPGDLGIAERRVRDLAAAVIEVSWQFAVAAQDPLCDLAFKGPIEQHLARELVSVGLDLKTGRGRHLATVELGAVPNLEATDLSVADALAARQDDPFESFRATVRLALDDMATARRAGVEAATAMSIFEERMQEESRRLVASARKATFKDRVKDAALPAAIGVATEFAVAPIGPLPAATAAAGVSITTVLWQWLLGRRAARSEEVCVRDFSMLGGDKH